MSAVDNKTPWNPSRRATARVKNPLPAPTTCPYDGGPVEIVNNSAIYGREYGEWPWAFDARQAFALADELVRCGKWNCAFMNVAHDSRRKSRRGVFAQVP